MNTGKTLKIVLVLAVVLIALAFVGKRKGWFGKAETIKVSVEQAKSRTIVETINGNGKIHPEKEVKITPDVSGEVVGLYVREGENVTQGTLLAKIKPDTYISIKARSEAALNSAKARQTQTEANLTQSRLSFDRSKTLWEQKTISRSDYEQAEATYKMAAADVASAKASVRSAEASLNEADENLLKTTLYAPIDGTIYGLSIEQGERVVGTALMSGTEMMRIADLSIMEVVVEINENDVVRVSYGDTALVEVDAYMDHKFKGVVTEIANSASTSGVSVDQVTSFNVKILLLRESYLDLVSETSPSPFRPGMSATVDIQTESKFGVLSVPIQSVTTRTDTLGTENDDDDIIASNSDDKEKVVVFVLSDDETMSLQQEVKTGIQDNNFIELIEGIDEEDKVIVAPYSAVSKKLSDSTLVEVVSKKDLFSNKKKKK